MKTVYSDYLEKMIPIGFTVDTVHFSWCEEDLVYWNDETEEDYYEDYYREVPKRAILD